MAKIERALISCHDKTGVAELALVLREFDVDIVTTEGTHRALEEAGVMSRVMADFTGVREMMSGRVKSLHPKVHAGLLGIRDNKLHAEEMRTYEFEWIDLLAVNVHPLEESVKDPTLTPEEVVSQIDIGGIAMIRSAAKNYRYVTVVVNPERYTDVIHELRAHEGTVSYVTRFRLAQEAFAFIAQYDTLVADYLRRCEPPEA
ncbi:MAG: IMP cyclohydrolase [Candidatus Hydrogenedentes bacterium]|nr:IMP cyclohydrolase [Candidatus Hydrogenedentota bacterium]